MLARWLARCSNDFHPTKLVAVDAFLLHSVLKDVRAFHLWAFNAHACKRGWHAAVLGIADAPAAAPGHNTARGVVASACKCWLVILNSVQSPPVVRSLFNSPSVCCLERFRFLRSRVIAKS